MLGLGVFLYPGTRRVFERVPGYPVFRIMRLQYTPPRHSSVMARGRGNWPLPPPPQIFSFGKFRSYLKNAPVWKKNIYCSLKNKTSLFYISSVYVDLYLSAFWSAISLSRQIQFIRIISKLILYRHEVREFKWKVLDNNCLMLIGLPLRVFLNYLHRPTSFYYK